MEMEAFFSPLEKAEMGSENISLKLTHCSFTTVA
jgi:hypothetical protein